MLIDCNGKLHQNTNQQEKMAPPQIFALISLPVIRPYIRKLHHVRPYLLKTTNIIN